MIIAITTGDADGVGTEVAFKALREIGPYKDIQFVVFRTKDCPEKYQFEKLTNFQHHKLSNADDVKTVKNANLIEVVSDDNPAIWVQTSARKCLQKEWSSLVTAPMSKTLVIEARLSQMGHTGILKEITKTKEIFMGFKGEHFNVTLVTDHVPLQNTTSSLSIEKICRSGELAFLHFRDSSQLPLGVLGLNPHSGENGLIGKEDESIIAKAIDRLNSMGIPAEGPLVPDAAFLKENWAKYCCYISMYHDQGLIPFKLVHGQDSGIQVSLGLPFLRTSVDHGTAKDIFNLDKANSSSMKYAIQYAIENS